jgi:putative Mg2+ transporter-C (MgtC) family protein
VVQTAHVIDLRTRLVGPRAMTDPLAALSEQPAILSVDTGEIDGTGE